MGVYMLRRLQRDAGTEPNGTHISRRIVPVSGALFCIIIHGPDTHGLVVEIHVVAAVAAPGARHGGVHAAVVVVLELCTALLPVRPQLVQERVVEPELRRAGRLLLRHRPADRVVDVVVPFVAHSPLESFKLVERRVDELADFLGGRDRLQARGVEHALQAAVLQPRRQGPDFRPELAVFHAFARGHAISAQPVWAWVPQIPDVFLAV